jgi:hypothetical protein
METTRDSWRRFTGAWRALDDNGKAEFVAYFGGYWLMALAVVLAFGFAGAVFVLGAVLTWAGRAR